VAGAVGKTLALEIVVTMADVDVIVPDVMIVTEVETTGALAKSFPPQTLGFESAWPTVLL
jgi:hypothetical protein